MLLALVLCIILESQMLGVQLNKSELDFIKSGSISSNSRDTISMNQGPFTLDPVPISMNKGLDSTKSRLWLVKRGSLFKLYYLSVRLTEWLPTCILIKSGSFLNKMYSLSHPVLIHGVAQQQTDPKSNGTQTLKWQCQEVRIKTVCGTGLLPWMTRMVPSLNNKPSLWPYRP